MEQHRLLPDGRLHLHHGPIDLMIYLEGSAEEVTAARQQAITGFEGLLATMVTELPRLRQPLGATPPELHGPVTRRMARAVWPLRGRFITPMAAVAGSVADEILARLRAGRQLQRAYVNNGGDIALYLAPGQQFRTGLVADPQRPAVDGLCVVDAADPVRGIATSGRGGRSFSLGIADAVTVLAQNAASADAAATLIANAVNIDHPAVQRCPAHDLDPDSDLGAQRVTVAVGPLEPAARQQALSQGEQLAREYLAQGLVHGVLLSLAGEQRLCVHDPVELTHTVTSLPSG